MKLSYCAKQSKWGLLLRCTLHGSTISQNSLPGGTVFSISVYFRNVAK